MPSFSWARSRVGGGRWAGAPGAPQPAAYRNLSGSPTRLPLPALFQGGVCGVETRTRREEELYNREKPRRTSGDRERQPEGAEGGAKSTRANGLETLGMGRICVHIKEEEFTQRRGATVRETSPGLSEASP